MWSNWFHKGWFGGWLVLHQILSGSVTQFLHARNHYTKLSMPFQVLGVWLHLEKNILRLRSNCNIKKVQKHQKKNIKSVKGCRDGMPRSMQTRWEWYNSEGKETYPHIFLHYSCTLVWKDAGIGLCILPSLLHHSHLVCILLGHAIPTFFFSLQVEMRPF